MIKKIFIFLAMLFVSLGVSHASAVESTTVVNENPTQIYKMGTTATVKGTVTDIQKVPVTSANIQLVRFTLKTDKGDVLVRVGPEKFVQRLNLQLNKGDVVEVTGSHVTIGNRSFVIAAEIKKDGSVFKLRDAVTGMPVTGAIEDNSLENRDFFKSIATGYAPPFQ